MSFDAIAPGNGTDLRRTRRQKLLLADPLNSMRLPPHSTECEQGVLGCCLLSPNECIYECVDKFKVGAEVFYDHRHQAIFQVLADMREKKEAIDIITVQQTLKDRQQLDNVGGLSYLSSLPDAVPSAANLAHYAEIVYEKYVLRKMIQTCTRTIQDAYEHEGEAESVLSAFERDALAVRGAFNSSTGVNLDLVLDEIVERVKRVVDSERPVGLQTGYRDLDRITGGLDKQQFWILSGMRSMGKTSLAFNICLNRIFNHGDAAGIVSLETSAISVLTRMMCARWEIDSRNLRSRPQGDELQRLFPAVAEFRKLKDRLFICEDSGMTAVKIRSTCRRWVNSGAKLIVVDFLQLVQNHDNRKSTAEKVGETAYAMKDMAKELKVPVIGIASLSRAGELKHSGDLDYAADVHLTLKKPDNVDKDDKMWPIICHVEKGKDSGTGTFMLDFYRNYFRFENETLEER